MPRNPAPSRTRSPRTPPIATRTAGPVSSCSPARPYWARRKELKQLCRRRATTAGCTARSLRMDLAVVRTFPPPIPRHTGNISGGNVRRMRTARLYGTADLRVGDEPAPQAGAGPTLVRVTAVGNCGSDLHWYEDGAIGDARLERPLVPGHEGAGEIAARPRRGERVAIDPAIPCEVCPACRDGYRNLCYNILFSGHGATDGMMRDVMPWPSHL